MNGNNLYMAKSVVVWLIVKITAELLGQLMFCEVIPTRINIKI